MPDWLPTALGMVAGILSTTSFVPQVKKAWQEGTESVSKRMYVVTVAAFVLWTTYGFLLGSLPLILFNAAAASAFPARSSSSRSATSGAARAARPGRRRPGQRSRRRAGADGARRRVAAPTAEPPERLDVSPHLAAARPGVDRRGTGP